MSPTLPTGSVAEDTEVGHPNPVADLEGSRSAGRCGRSLLRVLGRGGGAAAHATHGGGRIVEMLWLEPKVSESARTV
ncbi:hypothetical protein NJ76_08595 [Rhodococcus sp. IITR03]|nr:hypothetical protein NJ76_08595 [Rhodococcus sp. IITR03]